MHLRRRKGERGLMPKGRLPRARPPERLRSGKLCFAQLDVAKVRVAAACGRIKLSRNMMAAAI